MTDTTKNNVPDGFILLQTQNGAPKYAACMTGRLAGWLMKKYPDGNWVSERKLTNLEVMQAEDQRDDGIVHETPAATIQEPVMVAEPFDREEFIRQVSVSIAEMDRDSPEGQPEMMLVTPDELQNTMRSVFDRFDDAAPMVADPAGVAPVTNNDAFMAALDGYMDAVDNTPRNSDRRISQRLAIFAAAEAWKSAATVKAVPSEALALAFSREYWGIIFDGVMLEIERSQKRKESNAASNSDERVEQGKSILATIRKACAAPLADKTGGGE